MYFLFLFWYILISYIDLLHLWHQVEEDTDYKVLGVATEESTQLSSVSGPYIIHTECSRPILAKRQGFQIHFLLFQLLWLISVCF